MHYLEEENKIIEKRSYETMYGVWHYFTCSTEIDLENNNYITANTLKAYEQFRKYYNEKDLLPILIKVDDGIRLQRALNRERNQVNPKYDELCRRFLADSEDFSIENIRDNNIQDFCYNNKTIDSSLNQIQKIFKKHIS